jgi:hypothetical protein
VIVLHSNNSDTLSMVYTSREEAGGDMGPATGIYEWHGGIARGYDINNTWLDMCLMLLEFQATKLFN